MLYLVTRSYCRVPTRTLFRGSNANVYHARLPFVGCYVLCNGLECSANYNARNSCGAGVVGSRFLRHVGVDSSCPRCGAHAPDPYYTP